MPPDAAKLLKSRPLCNEHVTATRMAEASDFGCGAVSRGKRFVGASGQEAISALVQLAELNARIALTLESGSHPATPRSGAGYKVPNTAT
jgi:hypothetical protein